MNMKINLFVYSTTLIVFLIIIATNISCEDPHSIKKIERFETIVYDSCEYVFDIFTHNFEHKGNCKFCKERQ